MIKLQLKVLCLLYTSTVVAVTPAMPMTIGFGIERRQEAGEQFVDVGLSLIHIYKTPELIAVKVPVFSMSKLARVDVSLGPEMKSTGEVLGVGETLEEALYKGFTAAGKKMSNDRGVVLATVNDQDKEEFLEIAKDMKRVGYTFMATEGTASLLRLSLIHI